MPPRLPPKHASPTAANLRALRDGLTSVIAGHAQAITTYTFYEELDRYLGPWGSAGYPIGYGKFYNIAFTSNEKLRANPATWDWVWKTTILLQESLRDSVVDRFRRGTLASLSEFELRQAAFLSHPRAYTEGGLAMVAMVAPELIPVIMLIPRAEFSPSSPDYRATLMQVERTIEIVVPQMVGMGLAALMPAHSGILRHAARRDMQRLTQELGLSRSLEETRTAIEAGRLDRIVWLNRVTDRLNSIQFPDQGFADTARQIVVLADLRKRRVATTYREWLRQRPDLREQLDRQEPGWDRW